MRKFDNYSSALETLKHAKDQDLKNEFVQGGVISKFSLQFELGWKLMKELLKNEGDKTAATGSPREIIKAAYAYYDWMDEEIWLQMQRDRNDSANLPPIARRNTARHGPRDLPAQFLMAAVLKKR